MIGPGRAAVMGPAWHFSVIESAGLKCLRAQMKIRFGDCVLDTDERALLRSGQPIHLTSKAFQLLAFLLEVRPRAAAKAELQEKLWPSTFVSEGNLATLVKEARTAIGDNARKPLHIRTVHACGYAFAGNVHHSAGAGSWSARLPIQDRTGV